MAGHLTVVPPDAKAKPSTPKTVVAALDGTGRDVLAAMRHTLARKIDAGEVAGNSIAAAFRELRELDALIRQIDTEREAEEAKNADQGRRRRSFDSSAI